jgi:hypothetical protein
MTARLRRTAAVLMLLAAALFAGRWLVTFLSVRWWAETVSADSVLYLTRRALVGLGLDALAITLGALWFVTHAHVTVRVLAGIPPHQPGGNPGFRRLIGHPDVRRWAVGGAVLLAILVGGGASRWTDAVMLAWQGVRMDVADPALGVDAGLLMAQVPVWLRLHTLATLFVLVGLGLTGLAYILGAAVRLSARPRIRDHARSHLGVQLAVLSLILATSQLLRPYELASGLPDVVAAGVVQLHRSVSWFLAGLCLAGGVVAVVWTLRPLHAAMAGTWLALSATLVGAHYLVPDEPPRPDDLEAASVRQAMEARAFGIPREPSALPTRTPPVTRYSWWDQAILAGVAGGRFGEDVARRATLAGAPGWVVIMRAGPTAVAIRDDTLQLDGSAVEVSTVPPFPLVLGPQGLRPAAPVLALGDGPGVLLGGLPRRLVLAWALQAPTLLSAQAQRRVAWHLAPAERLRHAAPFAVWGSPRAMLEAGRLVWVVDGFVTAEAFPQARRRIWRAREVGYVRAGLIGIADALGGQVRIYLRPGHDSLAAAWARVAGPLVQPAERLSPDVAAALGYPMDLLLLQAELIAEDPTRRLVPDTGAVMPQPSRGRLVPGPTEGEWIVPILNEQAGRTEALVVGRRVGTRDSVFLIQVDSVPLAAPETLVRTWERFPFIGQVRDSVTAAGGRWEPGAVRYLTGGSGGGPSLYAPFYGIDATTARPRVLVVAVADGARLGAGRTLQEARQNLRGETASLMPRLWGDAVILEQARRWARLADSALRAGDLETLGRAFAALLSVLESGVRK